MLAYVALVAFLTPVIKDVLLYLLFLSNYGYMIKVDGVKRDDEQYYYNYDIDYEIRQILQQTQTIIDTPLISDTERKIVYSQTQRRPNQARFRKAVMDAC